MLNHKRTICRKEKEKDGNLFPSFYRYPKKLFNKLLDEFCLNLTIAFSLI